MRSCSSHDQECNDNWAQRLEFLPRHDSASLCPAVRLSLAEDAARATLSPPAGAEFAVGDSSRFGNRSGVSCHRYRMSGEAQVEWAPDQEGRRGL